MLDEVLMIELENNTLNSEIFTRILFSRNFASHLRSFEKIKPSRNGEITLLFTDVGKSCEYLTRQI